MKRIRNVLVGLLAVGGFVVWLGHVHAQQTGTESDTEVMIQAIEQTAPVPADSVPQNGTFWSAQNPTWPPLPANVLGLSVWPLGDGNYLLNDTNVDYAAMQSPTSPMMSSPKLNLMTGNNLVGGNAYSNSVYLTNLTAAPSGSGGVSASFSVGGGTNFAPYDILMTTNLTAPVAQWNWLGIGYTSNRYTFDNQPADLAFYLLAKPSQTMTVGPTTPSASATCRMG